MGLDMYLFKKTYIGGMHEWNKITGEITLKKDGKDIPIRLNRVAIITEEVAYWRKANAIHKWFVDNYGDGDDNCEEYDVSVDGIETLVGLCKSILNTPENKREEVAKETLPSQSGFFFGSTEYDEYYYEDLEDTINMLEPIIKEMKTESSAKSWLTYQASW